MVSSEMCWESRCPDVRDTADPFKFEWTKVKAVVKDTIWSKDVDDIQKEPATFSKFPWIEVRYKKPTLAYKYLLMLDISFITLTSTHLLNDMAYLSDCGRKCCQCSLTRSLDPCTGQLWYEFWNSPQFGAEPSSGSYSGLYCNYHCTWLLACCAPIKHFCWKSSTVFSPWVKSIFTVWECCLLIAKCFFHWEMKDMVDNTNQCKQNVHGLRQELHDRTRNWVEHKHNAYN